LIITVLAFCCSQALAAEEKKWLVGFAQDTMGNDWRVAQVRSLESAFAKQPEIDFFYTVAGGSTAQQILDIEEMIARKVDVLITSPRDAKAMDPIISKAYQAGIPVVLISRRIPSENFTTFIHPDNSRIAVASAKFIVEQLGGSGKIFILQHIPTSTPAIQRTKPFLAEIDQHKDVTIVAMKVANSLRGEAIKKTEEALAEKLQFDAIYAQSDSMASGAIMALKKADLDPSHYIITGIDYISEAREAIRRGEQRVSFTYPTGGEEGARITLDILNGKEVPKEYIIGSTMVTKDNVEQVQPIF
jgi:ribose transport system substrate-binding protein